MLSHYEFADLVSAASVGSGNALAALDKHIREEFLIDSTSRKVPEKSDDPKPEVFPHFFLPDKSIVDTITIYNDAFITKLKDGRIFHYRREGDVVISEEGMAFKVINCNFDNKEDVLLANF